MTLIDDASRRKIVLLAAQAGSRYLDWLAKSNPNHDARGRFATGRGNGAHAEHLAGGGRIDSGGSTFDQHEINAIHDLVESTGKAKGRDWRFGVDTPQNLKESRALAKAEDNGRHLVQVTHEPKSTEDMVGERIHHRVGGDTVAQTYQDSRGRWISEETPDPRLAASNPIRRYDSRDAALERSRKLAARDVKDNTDTEYVIRRHVKKVVTDRNDNMIGERNNADTATTTFRLIVRPDAHTGKEAGKSFGFKGGVHRDSHGRFARTGHTAKLGSRTHQTPTRIHGADHAGWLKHQAGERREHAGELRGERRSLRREQRGERRQLDRDHSRQSAKLDRQHTRETTKLETRHAREAAGAKNPAATAQRHADERTELSTTHQGERSDLRREQSTERVNLSAEHREARQDQRAGHQESIAELRRTQRETMTEALREIRDGRRAAREDREAGGGKAFGFKANNGGAQSGPVVNPQLTTPEVDEIRGRFPDAVLSEIPLAGSLLRAISERLDEWKTDASDDYAKVQAIEQSDSIPPPIVQMRGDGFDVADGWHRLAAFMELGRVSILGYVIDGSGRPISLTSREAKSWGGASISTKDLPDRGIGPEGGEEPENTYNLPPGDDIAEKLRAFFGRQAEAVLGVIPTIGQPLPDDLVLPDLAEYDEPMAEAFTPLISAYWDRAGKQIREKIGLEPDAWPGSWSVVDPHVREKIETAAFNFCHSTNATTSKTLADALTTLRGELIEGIVTHGESVEMLTDRVQGVFDTAERWRARRIASTEASRSVHDAQYASVEESGVVAGLEILISAGSCPLCQKLAAEVKRVQLGQNIAVIGSHPDYMNIKTAPFHPSCRCSCVYVLTPEYGGPENPEWGETLIQPVAPDDYKPPKGVPAAKPQPDAVQPQKEYIEESGPKVGIRERPQDAFQIRNRSGLPLSEYNPDKEFEIIKDVNTHVRDFIKSNPDLVSKIDDDGKRMVLYKDERIAQTHIFTNDVDRAGWGNADTGGARVFRYPYTQKDKNYIADYNLRDLGIDPVYVHVHELHHAYGSKTEFDTFSDLVSIDYHLKQGNTLNPEAVQNKVDSLLGWALRSPRGDDAGSIKKTRLVMNYLLKEHPEAVEKLIGNRYSDSESVVKKVKSWAKTKVTE